MRKLTTMTDHNYDHFGYRKSVAEHLADAEAAVGDAAPPPDPTALNFNPVEVSPGMWQLPNETNPNRFFRTEVEARREGITAAANAQRKYANYMNALPTETKSVGQEVNATYEAGRAAAMSEGITPEAWAVSAEIRAAYLPETKTGAELWLEHKRNRH